MSKITFETAFQKLEESVAKLEGGSLTLDQSLNSFEEGIHWSRKCHQFLEHAEKRIEIILKNEKGEPEQVEFELGA